VDLEAAAVVAWPVLVVEEVEVEEEVVVLERVCQYLKFH
jgi:hypothetical protein